MYLIDCYIQELQKRLPQKNRTDIGKEMRSTIEDMLPPNYSDEDVKKVLNELGNPAVLASQFAEKPMYLIGPRYYDLYLSLLKMIVPIALIIAMISLLGQFVGAVNEAQNVMGLVISTLVDGFIIVIEVCIQIWFWLTLTFAVMEHVNKDGEDPLTMSLQEWSVDELKNVNYVPEQRAISTSHLYARLCWTAIWGTIYFNADHLIGIYKTIENKIQFVTPTFNQELLQSYWLLIGIIIIGELIVLLVKGFERKWSKKVALFQSGQEILTTIILIFIISRPQLFNEQFSLYMAETFNSTAEQFMSRFIAGFIVVVVIITVFEIYDVWKKSRKV